MNGSAVPPGLYAPLFERAVETAGYFQMFLRNKSCAGDLLKKLGRAQARRQRVLSTRWFSGSLIA
jgi:hypothetical protein